MIRKVIQIDEGKCNGCGICADACHEGAIEVIGGKARLVRERRHDFLRERQYKFSSFQTGIIRV